MYTEATFQSQGDIAKLNSPKLLFRGRTCLQFYYHMYGSSMGTLNVYIHGRNVFSASGDKGDRWLKANVIVYIWAVSEVGEHFEPIV